LLSEAADSGNEVSGAAARSLIFTSFPDTLIVMRLLLLLALIISEPAKPASLSPECIHIIQQTDTIHVDEFALIERGIAEGSIASQEILFGATVTLRVLSDDPGRVSGSQARSILAGFFRMHTIVSFSFTKIDRRSDRPFATGRLVWIERGMRRSAQLFVALQRHAERMTISHFNVY